jgi:hypothetical protein
MVVRYESYLGRNKVGGGKGLLFSGFAKSVFNFDQLRNFGFRRKFRLWRTRQPKRGTFDAKKGLHVFAASDTIERIDQCFVAVSLTLSGHRNLLAGGLATIIYTPTDFPVRQVRV